MKLINIIAAFIYILFINQCIYAQEPDPNSFFPMDEGNFWQYAFLNDIVKEEYVSKDSLLPDGSRLIYVAINNIVYNLPQWFIDTNYNVFSWGFNPEVMSVFYKLDAQIGEEWWMGRQSYDSLQGEFRRVESIYNGYYFGKETVFKEIHQFSRVLIDSEYIDILRSRETLASGLGIVLKATDDWVEPPEYLVSAIINGDTLGTIVGIEDPLLEEPNHDFRLFQNYPNPFNSSTIISYFVPLSTTIRLNIYNLLGEIVLQVSDGFRNKGNYEIIVNLNGFPSGVYIYQLIANSKIISSKKMILLQ